VSSAAVAVASAVVLTVSVGGSYTSSMMVSPGPSRLVATTLLGRLAILGLLRPDSCLGFLSFGARAVGGGGAAGGTLAGESTGGATGGDAAADPVGEAPAASWAASAFPAYSRQPLSDGDAVMPLAARARLGLPLLRKLIAEAALLTAFIEWLASARREGRFFFRSPRFAAGTDGDASPAGGGTSAISTPTGAAGHCVPLWESLACIRSRETPMLRTELKSRCERAFRAVVCGLTAGIVLVGWRGRMREKKVWRAMVRSYAAYSVRWSMRSSYHVMENHRQTFDLRPAETTQRAWRRKRRACSCPYPCPCSPSSSPRHPCSAGTCNGILVSPSPSAFVTLD
jgi:hypothetical protein